MSLSPQKSSGVRLEDVVITSELARRTRRAPDVNAQNAAFEALAHCMAQEPGNLLGLLVHLALDLTQAGSAGVSVPETSAAGEPILRWAATAGEFAPYVSATIPRDSPCGACLDSGAPALYSRPARYFTFIQDSGPQIVEGLIIPMYARGRPIGTVWVVTHDDRHPFDSEDVRIMSSLADFSATVLQMSGEIAERRRIEEQLRVSNERVELAQEAADIGFFDLDLHSGCATCSAKYFELYGQEAKPGTQTTEQMRDCLHPDDRDRVVEAGKHAIETRDPYEAEGRIVWPDGSVHCLIGKGRVFCDAAGKPARLIGSVMDITNRRRAEQKLRQSNRRLKMLSEIANILFSEHQPRGAIRAVCNRLLAELGLSFYFHYQVSGDGRKLDLDSYHGIAEPVARPIRWLELGQAICGASALERRPIVTEDVQQSDDPRVIVQRAAGLKCYVCFPLLSKGRLLGTLSFGTREKNAFEPEELAVMETVVNQLAVALDRMRLNAQVELRASLINLSPDAIIVQKTDGAILQWNTGAEETYGWTEAEAENQVSHTLLKTKFPISLGEVERSLEDRGRWDGELVHTRKDGVEIVVESRMVLQRDENGLPELVMEENRDVTHRKQLEEQLRQKQKLESIGVLAGGIAHDFNNLLAGIMGNTSLAQELLDESHPASPLLEEAIQASQRAADLTSQMLAYAGKGPLFKEAVKLSALAADVTRSAEVSIPKNIEIQLGLADTLPSVEADSSQIRQVITSLVMNAVESIGDHSHGCIRISTGTEYGVQPTLLDAVGFELAKPGDFVFVEIQDNGCGMDEATMARIFDPFFTTKFTGRGLGLAAVQGIVRGHKGVLRIHSSPGQGSTFKLLLPANLRQPAPVEDVERSRHELKRSGVVLVVDDELIVRRAAAAILENLGYRVMAAQNGQEAVDLFQDMSGQISLVLLDLSMPVLSGAETAPQLKRIRPDVPIILTSGYSEDEALRIFHGSGLDGFLQKPYTAALLGEKLKTVIAKPPAPDAAEVTEQARPRH